MIEGISFIQMFAYLQGCRSRAGSPLQLSGGSILPYSSHSAGLQCCLGSLHSASPRSRAHSTEPFRCMCSPWLQLHNKNQKVIWMHMQVQFLVLSTCWLHVFKDQRLHSRNVHRNVLWYFGVYHQQYRSFKCLPHSNILLRIKISSPYKSFVNVNRF